MISYVVVTENRLNAFVTRVQGLLNEGWVLVGGVSIVSSGDLSSTYASCCYSQAMTKGSVDE